LGFTVKVMMLKAERAVFTLYGGGLLPPQGVRQSSTADGLKPIRTVGVMMLGAKRAVFTLYGGGLLPPQGVRQSSKADGLKPIRTKDYERSICFKCP
jgi:hypothetical protein